MVADGIFDEARGLEAGEAILGLALEVRVADEHAEHQLDAVEDVVGGDLLRFLLPTSSPKARRPLVSAARRPASWVPPSGVGMVLQ